MKGPGVATSPHPIRALFQCICLCKGKRENGNSGLCSWDIQREIFCEEPGKKALRAVAVKVVFFYRRDCIAIGGAWH